MVTKPVVKQTLSEPFGIIGWGGGLSFCKHRCGLRDRAVSRILKEGWISALNEHFSDMSHDAEWSK